MNGLSLISWFLAFLFLIGIIGLGVSSFVVDFQYEKQIGSYFNNAIDMNTPDQMLNQVNLGRKAIYDSGLTNEDYGAMWFKKPDNSMVFQMQHIDSIIERIIAVQEWKDKSYGNNTQVESMNDVYEQKMTNLRNFINEDINGGESRSDWIAKDAWYVKYHPIMYFQALFFIIMALLLVVFIIVGSATWSYY